LKINLFALSAPPWIQILEIFAVLLEDPRKAKNKGKETESS
jgi:hypothetical protein